MKFDVNEMRQSAIQLGKLTCVDDVYTFYYDESNNIRKLYLTNVGLNVGRTSNFVLAGILHKGTEPHVEFDSLIKSLHLQKTVKELKLKHIGKGDFEQLLRSKKLGVLLKWLLDREFYIHYYNLNVFYWSIVDIVDSVIEKLDYVNKQFFIPSHMSVKSDLYKVIINDEQTFLHALKGFEYPNIKPDRIDEFYGFLTAFVKTNSETLREDRRYLINAFIKGASINDELFFIMNEKDHILINNFFTFYLRNICLFKNSKHIFDIEKDIENIFNKYDLVDKDKVLDSYSFVDSKARIEVQISDVLAGLLAKYFTFISQVTNDDLKNIKINLCEEQKENLRYLRELINKSNRLSEGFFCQTISEDEYLRNNYFLHNHGNI